MDVGKQPKQVAHSRKCTLSFWFNFLISGVNQTLHGHTKTNKFEGYTAEADVEADDITAGT